MIVDLIEYKGKLISLNRNCQLSVYNLQDFIYSTSISKIETSLGNLRNAQASFNLSPQTNTIFKLCHFDHVLIIYDKINILVLNINSLVAENSVINVVKKISFSQIQKRQQSDIQLIGSFKRNQENAIYIANNAGKVIFLETKFVQNDFTFEKIGQINILENKNLKSQQILTLTMNNQTNSNLQYVVSTIANDSFLYFGTNKGRVLKASGSSMSELKQFTIDNLNLKANEQKQLEVPVKKLIIHGNCLLALYGKYIVEYNIYSVTGCQITTLPINSLCLQIFSPRKFLQAKLILTGECNYIYGVNYPFEILNTKQIMVKNTILLSSQIGKSLLTYQSKDTNYIFVGGNHGVVDVFKGDTHFIVLLPPVF